MPELPEVETIKKGLNKKILNKKIIDVVVLKSKSIKDNKQKFIKTLKGNSIKKIERRAKLFICTLSKGNNYLLIHLKMTGQLVYVPRYNGRYNDRYNAYSRVVFKFSDNSKLFFNDLRLFGYLKIVDEKEKNKILEKFGPEPLSRKFTLKKFQEILKGRKTNIKTLLMNQHLIAGIGNIYADEILFDAGVRPDRRVQTLKPKELEKIFKSIKKILAKAVRQEDTSVGDYIKADGMEGNFAKFLKVHGKAGQSCPRCKKTKIQKIKIAGRGTYFCPKCQK